MGISELEPGTAFKSPNKVFLAATDPVLSSGSSCRATSVGTSGAQHHSTDDDTDLSSDGSAPPAQGRTLSLHILP